MKKEVSIMNSKRNMLFALTLFMLVVFATTATAAATPSVTGIHPSAGPLAGGNAVTITGSGFLGATQVDFGGTAVGFSIVNDGSITLNAPAGTDYGQVYVHVTSSEGTSSETSADLYTYMPVASISDVSPLIGLSTGGTEVTIGGSYFTGADKVIFIDSNPTGQHFGQQYLGTNLVVDNDNQITITAPAGPLGDNAIIEVETPAGLSQPWVNSKFTWGTAPSVSSVSPKSGSVNGGNKVTITGSYFTGATNVNFGATPATNVIVVNNNKITATVPAGTGTVDVTVTTPFGTSGTSSADQYTYVQVSYITSITPTTGSYDGGNTIDILGYGFTGASKVVVGSKIATILSVTDNKISITVPQLTTQPGAPKTFDIQVTAAGGVSVNSSRDKYTYIAHPKIYSVSPAIGPTEGGTVVTLKGVGFTGISQVMFGDFPATAITFISDTQIKAITPQEDAGYASVVVTSTGGISDPWQGYFVFKPNPVVDSVTPSVGPINGGTKVTITGTNLYEVQKVMFGSKAATGVKVIDDSHIVATSPAGTETVDVTVVSPTGTSSTSDNDKFTYQQVTPKVTSLVPSSGSTKGGNHVAIYGSGFTGATAVKFGSVSVSKLTVTSDTKISVIAPAGKKGTVDVTVITPVGKSKLTTKDRYIYK